MASKVYTAHEMRDMANAVDDVSINDNGEYYYEKHDKFNPDLVRDMLRQAADDKERMEAVVKHLEKYKGTKEPDYCCADCIEDSAKDVGFSFASGDGGEK